MRTIDFSPLYRSVVGFDRLASLLETASVDAAAGCTCQKPRAPTRKS